MSNYVMNAERMKKEGKMFWLGRGDFFSEAHSKKKT